MPGGNCDALDEFFCRILSAGLERHAARNWRYLLASGLNRQTRRRAQRIAEQHYDFGNRLYQNMLDRRMVYSALAGLMPRGWMKHRRSSSTLSVRNSGCGQECTYSISVAGGEALHDLPPRSMVSVLRGLPSLVSNCN